MQHSLDEIYAAKMPFQVIKAKQELNLVVLEHSERTSELLSQNLHISCVNAAENSRSANAHRHACKPFVNQSCQPNSISKPFAYDGTLGSTVNERLDLVVVNLARDIEHSYVAEKLREVLLDHIVLLINHLLCDGIFDFLLCLCIVRISIHETIHLLKLLLFALHLLFHAGTDNLFEFDVIISCYGITELWVLMEYVVKLSWVAQVMLLDSHRLSMNSLSLLVPENLVKEVLSS